VSKRSSYITTFQIDLARRKHLRASGAAPEAPINFRYDYRDIERHCVCSRTGGPITVARV
jgi:hypothetical protein